MPDFAMFGQSVVTSTIGIDSAFTQTQLVTASSTANTKGAWAEIDSSLAISLNGFVVNIVGNTVSVTTDFLMDIGVGSAGNEEVIIPNILFSVGAGLDLDFQKNFGTPLGVCAGVRVAARIQATAGSASCGVSLQAAATSFKMSTPYQEIIAFGANTGDSGGVQVDPGGTANTKGAWSEIVASTSEDVFGLCASIGVQANANQRVNRFQFDIAVGSSGNEEIIIPDTVTRVSAAEFAYAMTNFMPVSVPSGSRLAVRDQSSDTNATDRLLDFILYGLR